MTDERKERITKAAIWKYEASEYLRGLGMLNANVPAEEARQNAITYALAQANLADAERELKAAIDSA